MDEKNSFQESPVIRSSDVVIIGAGFSGINLACQLKRKLGTADYVIYERSEDYGGAWFANRYPGCGVDIPAVLYSLSWSPNSNFSSIFPPQTEILEYIRRLARKHDIPRHMVLRTEWKGARWVEKTQRWHVFLQDLNTGACYTHEAKILVSAVGGYTNPKYPVLPGLETFQGKVTHTARWDEDCDLRDKDVVVVGNGCSASQVVPAIVDDVRSLTQVIRSPQYYLPMPNFHIHRLLRWLFYLCPFILTLLRWVVFWFLETSLAQFYDDDGGRRAREDAVQKSRAYIRKTAPEKYLDMLTPRYEMGCRRRILDCQYLKSLNSPKVCLTNDPITWVGEHSVRTMSGKEFPADIIVLATGFEFTQWQGDSVIGRNGVTMSQHWARFGGIEAYKTVAMNEFPNLFYLLGPNSGSGHTSVLYSIECSTDLILRLARPILERRVASVEVQRDAEQDWCDRIQSALRQTVLTKSCFSQFSNPVTMWNFFSYPFHSSRFWFDTRFPRMADWKYA